MYFCSTILRFKNMKTFTVTGYKMKKNPNTWEMERVGNLITIDVEASNDKIDNLEATIANKNDFDWFEFMCSSPK